MVWITYRIFSTLDIETYKRCIFQNIETLSEWIEETSDLLGSPIHLIRAEQPVKYPISFSFVIPSLL